MIERVHFKNFKSLEDVAVSLSPFTLFVGANASGKTSILQATHDLLQLVSPSTTDPTSVFSGAHHPTRVMRRGGAGHFELEASGPEFGTFGVTASGSEAGASVKLQRRHGTSHDQFPAQRSPSGLDARRQAYQSFMKPLRACQLGSVSALRLDALAAVKPHHAGEEGTRIRHDGTGLPSVIQRLQLLRDGRFEELEMTLAEIVPSIRRLRALPHPITLSRMTRVAIDGTETEVARTERVMGAKLEAELTTGQWIPADLLSEGTVLTLALLAVLFDETPRTLLIDDLDQGLHPTAQRKLVERLRAVQTKRTVQILATSHSPYMVDGFEAGEVRVVALIDGATQVRALNDHPRWNDASAVLDPGEFWSSVGEEWVGR